MKRRTVSLSDDTAAALDRIAKEHATTVSGVLEAAGAVLAAAGNDAKPIFARIAPDRRGGRRKGAGRPRGTKKKS